MDPNIDLSVKLDYPIHMSLTIKLDYPIHISLTIKLDYPIHMSLTIIINPTYMSNFVVLYSVDIYDFYTSFVIRKKSTLGISFE